MQICPLQAKDASQPFTSFQNRRVPFSRKVTPPRLTAHPSTPTPLGQCAGNTALQGLRSNRNATVTASTPRTESVMRCAAFLAHSSSVANSIRLVFFGGVVPGSRHRKTSPRSPRRSVRWAGKRLRTWVVYQFEIQEIQRFQEIPRKSLDEYSSREYFSGSHVAH